MSLRPLSAPSLLFLLAACGSGVKSGRSLPGLDESCVDVECANGLLCAHDGTCQIAGDIGTAQAEDDCSATVECGYGLVCSSENLCVADGADGTGAAGDTCTGDDDCQAGHFCDGGACADVGIPWWEGSTCTADDPEGFYPLFDVPDLPASGQIDFFSLPFPNDARLDPSGHPDLSGFPTPGEAAPAVDALLDSLEAEGDRWGLNPTIFFRFSQPQDISSLTALTDDATVWIASLDEDADDYGPLPSLQFYSRQSRGKYVCQNWLAISVYDGDPLLPGHTYAAWITKGVKSEAGEASVRDDGFKVMMGEERPEDLTMARAWDAYAPFRDYLGREGIDETQVAGATVFTTGFRERKVRYFREAVEEEGVTIEPTELVACDDGVTSPCDDGGARACGAAQDGFVEVHGLLGVPDYRDAEGRMVFDETSRRPVIQTTEDVCMAMTVPEGTPPEGGWPVALFVGDVEGTFRDAVDGGLAAALAAEGVATVSLELPGQGERGLGYFLPQDPAAWLGNRLQAVADTFAAERFVGTWSVAAEASPTGEALAFDPDDVWIVGAGEGAGVGVHWLTWSRLGRGGALGNPHGFVAATTADLAEPVDMHHALQAALGDSAIGRFHPAVDLLQLWFEGAEPVDDALGMVRDDSVSAKHVMVVHGVDDPSTDAVAAVLRAGSLPVAGDVLADYEQATTGLPATENVTTDDGRRTAASIQVAGGRTAVLEMPDDVAAFVGSGLGGASPTIE